MCILFIYTNPNPEEGTFRLIIASNRDEYYQRPAQSAYFSTEDNIIGGRDMEKGREGGMWLGISLNKSDSYKFRFGALLNVTGEEHKLGALGRGFIVTDYLKSNITCANYLESLQNGKQHSAFNFVAVELSNTTIKAFHHSNTPISTTEFEGKQILGFGNSTLASPLLKVTKGIDKFTEIIEEFNNVTQKEQLISELINLLEWDERHLPDPELQRRAPSTYELLSSIFLKIVQPGYGTRTHSIIVIDYDWNMEFIEHTMKEPIDPENPQWIKETIKAHL